MLVRERPSFHVAELFGFWYAPRVASCRYCNDEIFFAWHPQWLRWLPIEPESISGDEQLTENDNAVIYESYHRRHRCMHGHEKWAQSASDERSRREASERDDRARAAGDRHRADAKPFRSESSPHATLFVTRDAPIEVIRAAYKALALLYHPDLGGDAERMVELNGAYDVLVGKYRSL